MARLTQQEIEERLERCCSGNLPDSVWKQFVLELLTISAAGSGLATEGELTWTTSYANGTSGTVAAGAQSVSFLNTGTADALVNGEILASGDSVCVAAFLDPVLNIYNLVPEIAYDAQTSILRIDVVTKDTV